MIRSAAGSVVVFSLIAGALLAEVQKKTDPRNEQARFVGAWSLVSTEETLTDGSKRPYLDVGPNGKGYLMYTADGHMCAAGMNPDRPAWIDVNKPTDAEKLRAMDSFFGYCGRYEIDIANHVMYHYPEVALDPGFVGSEQKRPYRLDGDVLTFSDKDTTPGIESYAITWRKVK